MRSGHLEGALWQRPLTLKPCTAMDEKASGTQDAPRAQEMGMTQQAFAYPFMYWVGMNTPPDTDPTAVAEFSQFYSKIHVPEVVASNPGFVRGTRYELLQPDPRGDWGPRWLAVYEMDGEAAARTYAARNDGPPEGRPRYTPGPAAWQQTQSVWRMIWRQVSSCRHGESAPALHLHGRHECSPRHGRGRAGGVQRVLHGHPRP